jgi:FtsP/CotA-like multicopper oxidase with cupredoxin domain
MVGRHSRREVLMLGAVASFALAVPVARRVSASSLIDAITAGLPEPDPTSPFVPAFSLPFRVPPTLKPVRSTATTDFFEIVQRTGLVQILPGRPTPVWTYDGIFPGPTLPLRSNREAIVTQFNRLAVPVSTHLHGGVTPPESDGHPLLLIPPGASRVYTYPLRQDAEPLWYHDHADHATGRNVWMGLAATTRMTDDRDDALPLPKPPFDVPLIILDRLFNADNTLLYPQDHDGGPAQVVQKGALGDVILVNGVPQPRMAVKRRKYRFRLLNASNARQYLLALDHDIPFTVVASDGGLMPNPVTVFQLPMGNAERYHVVVDFSKVPTGTRVVLRNLAGEGRTSQVMRFDVGETVPDTSSVPAQLRPPLDINPADAVITRHFRFKREHGAWTINGQLFDGNRIDAFPQIGTTEIWELENSSGGWTHPVHIHLIGFKILSRNGASPRPWETGPKDVVMVGPNETIRLAIRWKGFRGIYVFHCHNMEHEDHDMMSQFEVI